MDATLHTNRVTPQVISPHDSLIAGLHALGVSSPPMNWAREIGKRLRAARRAVGVSGISLQELSNRTSGVLSPSRISNYEQGLRLLKPRDAQILGKALNADPAYLMCLEGGEMLPEEVEFLHNWRALPEKDRRDYARRIAVLALAHKEPVPDERLKGFRAPVSRKPKRRQVAE